MNVIKWRGEDATLHQASKTFDPINGTSVVETQTAIKVIKVPAGPADIQTGFQEGSYKIYANTDIEPVVNRDYVVIDGKRYDIKRVTAYPDFQVWEVVENG